MSPEVEPVVERGCGLGEGGGAEWSDSEVRRSGIR